MPKMHKHLYIDENQLIVGRSGKPGILVVLYPELDEYLKDEAVKMTYQAEMYHPFEIPRKMQRRSLQSRSPYWKEEHS